MARALVRARRASGRTFPNPPVGAVLLRGDRVLGAGETRPAGGPQPHAEAVGTGGFHNAANTTLNVNHSSRGGADRQVFHAKRLQLTVS
jgi:diaminohydroxyphosphoribosylaminopyrimidine deaminase/5-amino-6-(5-phosphoribosylamino)uracil reductase